MAWLALVAALLSVAAPTVSRVVLTAASKTAPILMEMCTTSGLKTVDVSSFVADGEPARPMKVMDEACGYCTLATPLLVVLALLFGLLQRPPPAPSFHVYSLLQKTLRNLRGLGSQAPPLAL